MIGSTTYLPVDKDMLKYLGINKPEEARILVKAEKSEKYGNYLGFGVQKVIDNKVVIQNDEQH